VRAAELSGVEGPEDAESLGHGGDVMDAEDGRPTGQAEGEQGDGGGIAGGGVRDIEHLADHGLAGDGQEDGALVGVELIEVAEEREIFLGLFGEVDAWVEHDVVAGQACAEGEVDLLAEEGVEGSHDVGVMDMGMADLWQADRVHDEEGGVVIGAEAGILGVWECAHVIEEIDAERQRPCGHLWAPGIDGEQRWPELVGAGRGWEGSDEGGPGLEEGAEASELLGGRDGGDACACGLGADIDAICAIGEVLAGAVEGMLGGWGGVAGERVWAEIDDAHQQGATWEVDGPAPGAEGRGGRREHGLTWAGGVTRPRRGRAWWRWVPPRA
jgi:hypothetical protein